MQPNKFIAYYRVSTKRQGQSGLGLEAQQHSVQAFLHSCGGILIGEYTEIETGKRNNRPQLQMALAAVKKAKGRLIIAKLDRLARNAAFVLNLLESSVDFVAADMPDANKLTIQIMAAFAEHERDQISERTKAALAAAKTRGVVLGANGRVLAKQHKVEAQKRAESLRGDVDAIKNEGHTTVRDICNQLNVLGINTPAGKQWHPTTTYRLLKRLAKPGGLN
jgi:DNA invertase Pin-like site-specific DNA recombinase